MLRSGLGSAAVVRGSAGLLRQLAGSDGVKAAVVAGNGLELINRALAAQAPAPAALEQVCVIWGIYTTEYHTLGLLTPTSPGADECARSSGALLSSNHALGASGSPSAASLPRRRLRRGH